MLGASNRGRTVSSCPPRAALAHGTCSPRTPRVEVTGPRRASSRSTNMASHLATIKCDARRAGRRCKTLRCHRKASRACWLVYFIYMWMLFRIASFGIADSMCEMHANTYVSIEGLHNVLKYEHYHPCGVRRSPNTCNLRPTATEIHRNS